MQRFSFRATSRRSRRIAALRILAVLSLASCTGPLGATIGDVLETHGQTFGDAYFWAFSEVTGRYCGYSGGLISVYARNGTLIRENGLSNASEVSASGGRGMAMIGGDTWLLLGTNGRTLTKWLMGEDAGGDLTLTGTGTIDISARLSGTEQATAFARASDGTLWFIVVGGSSGPYYLHLTSDGSRELGRLADLSSIFGISNLRPYFGYGADRGRIAVEQLTNRLLIEAGSRPSNVYVYYINPAGPSLLGRFKFDSYLYDHWVGANGSVLARLSTPQTVRFSVEEETLPTLADVRYDPGGVIWTPVAPCDPTWSFSIRGNWGTSGPKGFVLSPPYTTGLNETATINGDWIDVVYKPCGLKSEFTRFPDGYWIKQLHLINGDDQISELITLPLDIGDYHGGAPGSPASAGSVWGSSLWSVNRESSLGGSIATWSAAILAPYEPIDAEITFSDWVPWLGGKTFGIDQLQAAAECLLKSKGQGFVSLGGGGRLDVGSGFIGIKLGGGVKTELTTTDLVYSEGHGIIDVSGGVSEEAGLLRVFPILEAFKAVPVIGRVFEYLDKRAQTMAEIRLEMLARPQIVSLPETGDLALAGDLAGALVLTASAAVDVWSAQASVLGEARAQINYSSNASTSYALTFQDFTLQGLFGYNIVFWGVKYIGQEVLTVKYTKDGGFESPPRRAPRLLSSLVEYTHGCLDPAKQRPVVEPYIITPNPFEAIEQSKQGVPPSHQKQEIPVIGGLATDALPVTAFGAGGTMMVVWQQEVAGRPPMQATDIYYSYFDGKSFSPPAPISADTHGDFHPKVAYHNSGVWVAIWERVNRPDLPTTGDPVADAQAQVAELIPAVSLFDPATRAWSAPQHLDTEGTCYLPKLATGPSYDITAFWLKHPQHEIFPVAFLSADTTSGTNRLWYARFTASGFETPQPVNNGEITSVVDYAAADNGTEVRFAVSWIRIPVQYLDHETLPHYVYLDVRAKPHTPGAVRFVVIGNQLNGIPLGPEIIAMSDGTWRVAWKRYQPPSGTPHYCKVNPHIRLADDPTNLDAAKVVCRDPTAAKPDSPEFPYGDPLRWGAYQLDEFKLSDAGNGQAFLVYKDIIDGEPNLRLVFDDAAGVPSGAGALLTDSAMEKATNVAMGSRGEVLVTYQKTDLIRTTQTVDVGGVPTDLVEITEALTGVLTFMQPSVGRDLTVGEVSLRGGFLLPGTTLTLAVDVESLGALSVQDPTVTIFARQFYPPPASPGEELFEIVSDIPVVAGVMPGFAKETVEVQWVFPEGIFLVYAMVDPNERINEDDEQNNIGPTTVLGIDYPVNTVRSWQLYR